MIGRVLGAAAVSAAVVFLVGLFIDQEIHTRFAIISAIIGGGAAATLGGRSR